MSKEEETIFVSMRVADLPDPTPGSAVADRKCSQCGSPVWVSPASRPLLEKADRVLCMKCAPPEALDPNRAEPPFPEQAVEIVEALLPQAVKELRELARAHPWVPVGPPPARHYRGLGPGISVGFTLDMLPGLCAEHLSVSFHRPPGAGAAWIPNIKALEVIAKAFFGDATTERVIRTVTRHPGMVVYHLLKIIRRAE